MSKIEKEISQLETAIEVKLQNLIENPKWEINQLLRKRNKLAAEINKSKLNLNDIFNFIEFGYDKDGGEIILPI